MTKTLLVIVAVAGFMAAVAPAFASTRFVNCNSASKASWATCVFDQPGSGG